MTQRINFHNYLVLCACLKQLQNYGILEELKREVARQKNRAAIDVFKEHLMLYVTHSSCGSLFRSWNLIDGTMLWSETPQGYRYWYNCIKEIQKLYGPFQLEKVSI